MTCYIRRSYPAKKLELLQWREQELVVKIRKGLESEELFGSAERVREAQLAYLKGKKYYLLEPQPSPLPPESKRQRRSRHILEGDYVVNFDSTSLAKVEADMNEWQAKPVQEIIEQYKRLGLEKNPPS
jgi:hypothetical protein